MNENDHLNGKICGLSIDGAGLRNNFAGKALAYLETISGDSNAAICDYFDVTVGTGVGGVFGDLRER
ncbi:patatin-like protein 6 [Artemisia annua]|uniref:Patatin-like protein 6 n=1 Tax=Artemisia annua TaxID=35608 RepID=A0A2U1NHW5_ARTAN|nr:patatin-like protein 6 [Artemisia annua]